MSNRCASVRPSAFLCCVLLVASYLSLGTTAIKRTHLASYRQRPEVFTQAFPLEIVEVTLRDAENVVLHTIPMGDAGPPRRWTQAGRSVFAKSFAPKQCFEEIAHVEPIPVDEDQYLVVRLSWNVAKYMKEEIRLPVHIHVDPNAVIRQAGMHTEIIPTNVWQETGERTYLYDKHVINTCPHDVGNPEAVINLCKFPQWITTEPSERAYTWDEVYCPASEKPGGAVKNPGLEKGLKDVGEQDLKSDLPSNYKEMDPEMQLQTIRKMSFDKLSTSNSRMVLHSLSHLDHKEIRPSGEVFPKDCPSERFCEGTKCLPCCDEDLYVKIQIRKLKYAGGYDPEIGLQSIQSLAFKLHDNHGIGGDSMGEGHVADEAHARLFVPLRWRSEIVSEKFSRCPEPRDENDSLDNNEEIVLGLLHGTHKISNHPAQAGLNDWLSLTYQILAEGQDDRGKLLKLPWKTLPLFNVGTLADKIAKSAWVAVGLYIRSLSPGQLTNTYMKLGGYDDVGPLGKFLLDHVLENAHNKIKEDGADIVQGFVKAREQCGLVTPHCKKVVYKVEMELEDDGSSSSIASSNSGETGSSGDESTDEMKHRQSCELFMAQYGERSCEILEMGGTAETARIMVDFTDKMERAFEEANRVLGHGQGDSWVDFNPFADDE